MKEKEEFFKDTLITVENEQDKIILSGVEFSGYSTIALKKSKDFNIRLEFYNLTEETIEHLVKISNLPKEVSIESDVINKNQYPIKCVVIVNQQFVSDGTCILLCISDNPDLYSFVTDNLSSNAKQ